MPSLKPHFSKLITFPLRTSSRSLSSSLPIARFVTSAHSNVSSSTQTGMAEVLGDLPKTFVPPVNLDQIDSIASRPDPLVLTPVEGALGFEASNKQEAIGRPIYLDMQATTPMDPRVLDAMMPYMTNQYGNPHSKTHAYGWETEKAVETARGHVADLIGANAKDIIFTSGATETNNMVIKGVALIKTSLILYHHHPFRSASDTLLPLRLNTKNGLIDLQELEAAIRPDTVLVSIMAVNNEIGVIQPLKAIGEIVRKHQGVFFHTDAAQAVGKIEIDVDEMKIDLLSMSSHKLYGPKGIGAAYVRRRPRVRLEPIMSGGGQERGLRSGTVPAPSVVGFGEACRLAKQEMKNPKSPLKEAHERGAQSAPFWCHCSTSS
ncbi:hypothetical protein CROQUDRAFT_105139 [Cronartium quercuum f. sp. fusiforme G11]|uniref:cysteine desulfurase n=1 Tax=Cronartium quercuum f. sp. fusiforme G11 TaxID=708437 RepID=A0A9P6NLT3_9BASI|nr:hypothetical protein CROQUDRAFT_105139 [Cronartium quercuum f. sp. fusiforme G11]